MATPYIGQIIMFGGNFAPQGYAFCNGQLLPIAQYDALFALIGTTYGGDGQNTFALPDLRDRAPMHMGQGTGLSIYTIGQIGGTPEVTLTAAQLPTHGHNVQASSAAATTDTASASVSLAATTSPTYGAATNLAPLGSSLGAGQPHNNRQPYLGINFCIALEGIFPSRN